VPISANRRLLTALLPLALLTAGCGETRDAVTTVADCAGLVSDIAGSGLSGVPTQEQAETAVRRLDERVSGLSSPEVREAAGDLRDRLRELQEAARSADPAAATAAADRARAAASATADACGVPLDQLLGGNR
jgi:hypothetical protein